MCGVIGYHPVEPTEQAAGAFVQLFEESRVRGRHAYGLATQNSASTRVLRTFDAAAIWKRFVPGLPTIAHTRYSTSGDWQTLENNQPVVVDGIALAFNGVIHMGTKAEFEAAFDVSCTTDNDGEVFLRWMLAGGEPTAFLRAMRGSFAGVWLKDGRLHAARNQRRPLWRCDAYGAYWYASTRDIFERAAFPSAHLRPVDPWCVEVCL